VPIHAGKCIMYVVLRGEAAGLTGVIAAVLLAAGCAGMAARDARTDGGVQPKRAATEPRDASSDLRRAIAELALSMVGVPYRYGGADPTGGFDCSGLVYYTYSSHGQAVPRTSRAQFEATLKISLAEAAVGDLLFFEDEVKLSHVGIYLGDRRFVHAPSSDGTVSVASIDTPYYQRHLVAVGRLIPWPRK
jgi:cell wall-associated NlpC family hydrolase